MIQFEWSDDKNDRLQRERGMSFEDVVFHIYSGDILEITDHPNQECYPNQKLMFLRMEDYVYLVPYVREEDTVFLKTIIPSRKAAKKYLSKNEKKDQTHERRKRNSGSL